MAQMTTSPSEFADLPPTLKAERYGAVAVLRLNSAAKRNALDDQMVHGIGAFFAALPDDVRAVVLAGEGEHFSAGLDLTELTERDIFAGVEHSRSWHRAFEAIEFGKVPVVAVLHGAVVGGGLEMAATVDALFGFSATAGIVTDWMFEGIADSFADGEAERFLQRDNPWALNAIVERLLEAEQRQLWVPKTETLKKLHAALLASEATIEEVAESPYET